MKTLGALLLVALLSVCAYAGEMDNGVISPPPSAPATASTTTEPAVNEPADSQAAETTITEAALGLLQSALSVF
jgi:hypothetical protein